MVGHGGPRQAPLAIAPTGSKFAASIRGLRIAMCVCALVAFGIPAGAQDNDIRLRITWGEGSERRVNNHGPLPALESPCLQR